jgi:hypothetical protein
MYNMFSKKKAKLCPGGACTIKRTESIQKITTAHLMALFLAFVVIICGMYILKATEQTTQTECEVPQWAQDIGHEEQYRLHHGCE